MGAIGPFLLGALTGAGLSHILDPDMGSTRRARIAGAVRRTGDAAQEGIAEHREQTGDTVRRKGLAAQRQISGRLDQVTDRLFGTVADALPDDEPANDQTLVAKVRSEVLGDPRWKGRTINVDAAEGSVTLRGEVEDEDQRDALVKAVEKVTGVQEVESLLHLPGEAPPNTEAPRAGSALPPDVPARPAPPAGGDPGRPSGSTT